MSFILNTMTAFSVSGMRYAQGLHIAQCLARYYSKRPGDGFVFSQPLAYYLYENQSVT
jgi:hypothetical protein